MKRRDQGFTIVETTIIICVISLLLVIVVPNFLRIRREARAKVCIGNLRQIASAVEQRGLFYEEIDGIRLHKVDLIPEFLKFMPECPSGGKYYGDFPPVKKGGDKRIKGRRGEGTPLLFYVGGDVFCTIEDNATDNIFDDHMLY